MGIALFSIGLFANLNYNNLVVVTMCIDLFFFQTTLGSFTWVYIGQVADEKQSAIVMGCLWFFTFILALTTDSLFTGLGNAGTFWLFSGLTLCGFFVFMCTIKETKGLTDDEIKNLFVPEDLKKAT